MNKIKFSLRYFTVVVFITANLGVTMHRMVCLYGCTSEISFSEINDCCSNDESKLESFFKPVCCEFSSTTFNLDDFSASPSFSLEKTSIHFFSLKAAGIRIPSGFSSLLFTGFFPNRLPLPDKGRDFITFILKLSI